jgi:hypothetical protein
LINRGGPKLTRPTEWWRNRQCRAWAKQVKAEGHPEPKEEKTAVVTGCSVGVVVGRALSPKPLKMAIGSPFPDVGIKIEAMYANTGNGFCKPLRP